MKLLIFVPRIFFQNYEILLKEISKNDFGDLQNLPTKKSFFTFNKNFYIQVDKVAIGSCLGPTLVTIFLSHYEKNLINVLQNLNQVFMVGTLKKVV